MLDDLKNTVVPLVQGYFSKYQTIEENTLDIFLDAMGLLEEWKEEKGVLWTTLCKYAVNGQVIYISAIKGLIELLSSLGEAELNRISRISFNPITNLTTPTQTSSQNQHHHQQGEDNNADDSLDFTNAISKIFNDYTSDILRKIRSLFFITNMSEKKIVTILEVNDYLNLYPFYHLTHEEITAFLSVFSKKRNKTNEDFVLNQEYFNFFNSELDERVLAYIKASETQNNENYTEDISNFNEFFTEVHQTEDEIQGCLKILFEINYKSNEDLIHFLNREIQFLSIQRMQKIEAIKSFISKQKEDVQCLENDLYLMHEKCLEKERQYANEEDFKKTQYTTEINSLNEKLITKEKDINHLKEELRHKEMNLGSLYETNTKLEKEFEDMRKKLHRLNEEKENYKKEYYNKLNECLENINKEKHNDSNKQQQVIIPKEANTLESKISRDANPLFESMNQFGLVEQTRSRLQLMDFEKLLAYSVKVDIDNQQLQSDKSELIKKNQDMTEEIQRMLKLIEENKQEISILKSNNDRLENRLAEITDDLEQKAKFDSTLDPLLIRISRISQLEPINSLAKVSSNMTFGKTHKGASLRKADNNNNNEIIEEEDEKTMSIGYGTKLDFLKNSTDLMTQGGMEVGGQYDINQSSSMNFEGGGGLTFQKNKQVNKDESMPGNSDDDGDMDYNNDLYFDADKDNIFQKIQHRGNGNTNITSNQKMPKEWQSQSSNTFNVAGLNNENRIYSESSQMMEGGHKGKKIIKTNANMMSQYFCTERLKEREYNKKLTGKTIIKEEQNEEDNDSSRKSCRSQSPKNKKASSKKLKAIANSNINNANVSTLRESIPIFQGETKEDVQKRILKRQNEHTSYDFMSLKLDEKINDLFDTNNEILNSKDMFSDNVFLIDPVKNKKNKYNILITPNSIYILKVRDLNVHQKYERSKLYEISISDKNSNLLCFHFDNIEELVIESLRRTEMLIFIRDYEILKGNSKVKFKYMDTFTIQRSNKTIMCVTNSERLAVVPNFENAKKMGYLYLMKDVFFVNTFKEKFVVLTDVGLLVFDDLSKDPKYLPIINSEFTKCQEGAYKRPFCFEIKTIRKKDVYVFASKNQDDFDSWMNQFSLMTNEYKTKLKRLDTKPTEKDKEKAK